MDTTILEVVLGLALIYAVLAVLVMKLQELWFGNLLRYRTNVLHDLLTEATGGDEALKKKLLQNPLVFALYRGSDAEKHSVLPDSGPSSIPPDVFARALLAELNGGTAPALAHASPSAFFTARAPATLLAATGGSDRPGATAGTDSQVSASGVGNLRIWQALQTLLAGNEASWSGFQAAIAGWFSDIGDRSEGWFQRMANWRTLALSLLLVAALNVDSLHIANSLATDAPVRLGLADLALRVDSQRRSGAAGQGDQPAPASAAAQPMQQLASRMTDAIHQLNAAFLDEAIGGFTTDLAPIKQSCDIVGVGASPNVEKDRQKDKQRDKQKDKQTDEQKDKSTDKPLQQDGQLTVHAMLGNAHIWGRVLPLLQARLEAAQLEGAVDAGKTYRAGYRCVAQISAWVRSATVHTSKAATRAQMQEAAAALESVKSALLTLAERQQGAAASLRRAYQADPDAFQNCQDGAESRSAFDACLRRELAAGLRLPLFWNGEATRTQFCHVERGPAATSALQPQLLSITVQLPPQSAPAGAQPTSAPASAAAAAPAGKASAAVAPTISAAASAQLLPVVVQPAASPGWPCDAAAFAGDARLGLPALQLHSKGGWSGWLLVFAGWLVSALFIALGAPFWFDLIGKVARLRSAGAVRDAAADAQRGRGTQPLPAPAGDGAAAAGSTGGDAADGDGQTPFSDSRNRFEDGLLPVDVLRVQQRLPAEPTGRLDTQTRAAIRAWCVANGQTPVVEELDAVLFLRIVGRPASQGGSTSGSPRPTHGTSQAAVPALATALMQVLRQPGRVDSTQTLFGADLRALAVLFRYHQQRLKQGSTIRPQDCTVFSRSRTLPALLDEVDDLLEADILKADASGQRITFEPPCWMDWAIGELGQVENDARSRAGSNPRILDYLNTAQAGADGDGDHTPWCGAFVAWVLLKYSDYRTAHAADTARDGDPLKALAASDPTLAAIKPVKDPLRAEHWTPMDDGVRKWPGWGQKHVDWKASARFGDIVLFKPQSQDSSGHVAFVVAWDGQQLWALGGNQSRGSRVSVEAWDAREVVAVMTVAMPPPPSPPTPTPIPAPGQTDFDPAI
ncbi:MAG TPA: CHAP domain-containing protein [Aquabacterium sp.]|nr:CHAP domain-containing protein [Aquabacterium sp.]HQC97301.1 CHAP domain-containing protein [Aquabacterium sp.]